MNEKEIIEIHKLNTLVGANLSGADLNGANLTEADLYEANLIEANLRRANLTEADLRRANLTEANLSGAWINGANLSGADLRNADIKNTELINADFTDSKLSGADFNGSCLDGANFTGVCLEGVNFGSANISSAIIPPTDRRNKEEIEEDETKAVIEAKKTEELLELYEVAGKYKQPGSDNLKRGVKAELERRGVFQATEIKIVGQSTEPANFTCYECE